jgi:hypothetical protein
MKGPCTIILLDSAMNIPKQGEEHHLPIVVVHFIITHNGAFTLDIKLVLNENLGGILGGRHPMLNEQ